MTLTARLKPGESLGDRVIKVNHAGEHGAISIYTAQRWVARWRAPEMVAELDGFLSHERRHRALFEAALADRHRRRCRSYHICGIGGLMLGVATGFMGRRAIAATTIAVERVVLRHLEAQIATLVSTDPVAAALISDIVRDEQAHYDLSDARLDQHRWWTQMIDAFVTLSTESVIWLGMRL